jgi:hypothetical protein
VHIHPYLNIPPPPPPPLHCTNTHAILDRSNAHWTRRYMSELAKPSTKEEREAALAAKAKAKALAAK